jgi:ABC-2 type transport system ATP-binding protein
LTELAEVCDGAVIIEKGQILRAGTLDEILEEQSSTSTRRGVMVRSLIPTEDLHKKILESPHVVDVRTIGKEVAVEIEGADESCADLLKHLLASNIPVVEFRQKRAGLEEIFMNVTKGEVQ